MPKILTAAEIEKRRQKLRETLGLKPVLTHDELSQIAGYKKLPSHELVEFQGIVRRIPTGRKHLFVREDLTEIVNLAIEQARYKPRSGNHLQKIAEQAKRKTPINSKFLKSAGARQVFALLLNRGIIQRKLLPGQKHRLDKLNIVEVREPERLEELLRTYELVRKLVNKK